MEYVIRGVKEEELDKLVEICARHADYEKAPYDPTGKARALHKALFTNNPRLFCYVVEANEKPVGYFTYTFDFSTWDARQFMYLDCLYLEPEFRGKGIGSHVMKQLKLVAKQNNCVNIQWQTPVFNEPAIKFYKGCEALSSRKERFVLHVD